GVFEMTEQGLMEVPNPSALFLAERQGEVAGATVFAGIEGTRPVLVELQALVAPSPLATPRRSVLGWDGARLAMILAVLQRRVGVAIAADDVYVSTIGGARVTEPAADVALALALASARTDAPVRSGLAAIGEVALSGAVRPVTGLGQRVAEAARLGFTEVIVPATPAPVEAPRGVTIHAVSTVREAVERAVPRA
uniref:S16 family serine protease n=1 Tax=uncultured Demequina sp. TaxID=693499 RepID=UPI0025F0E9ED